MTRELITPLHVYASVSYYVVYGPSATSSPCRMREPSPCPRPCHVLSVVYMVETVELHHDGSTLDLTSLTHHPRLLRSPQPAARSLAWMLISSAGRMRRLTPSIVRPMVLGPQRRFNTDTTKQPKMTTSGRLPVTSTDSCVFAPMTDSCRWLLL